ncbi:MAG: hypothetical protein COC06_10905 [Bacteroidales bacterium]|nr:MAG: hypothetical protein COC06_10905 [Bacteroidales bacterium]
MLLFVFLKFNVEVGVLIGFVCSITCFSGFCNACQYAVLSRNGLRIRAKTSLEHNLQLLILKNTNMLVFL